jgi:hypothetical protein
MAAFAGVADLADLDRLAKAAYHDLKYFLKRVEEKHGVMRARQEM